MGAPDPHFGTMDSTEADIVAFHPGPPADFAFPNPPMAAAVTRLAEVERVFLERLIERHADRGGAFGDMARRIIVLRAEVAREQPSPTQGNH